MKKLEVFNHLLLAKDNGKVDCVHGEPARRLLGEFKNAENLL